MQAFFEKKFFDVSSFAKFLRKKWIFRAQKRVFPTRKTVEESSPPSCPPIAAKWPDLHKKAPRFTEIGP